MTDQVELVAEALWQHLGVANHCDPPIPFGEIADWRQEAFRNGARAAIDALQLTQETQLTRKFEPVPDSPYSGHRRPCGWETRSRLVSPWVAVEGGTQP